MSHANFQLKKLLIVAFFMALGLFLFKYIPMEIWGEDILFDASAHITVAFFALYVFWFFVDQNKNWRIPFFVLSALIIFIISVERIIANAHNDLGLLLGFLVSAISIFLAERKNLKGKLKF